MNRLFQTLPWAVNTNIYEVNVRQYTEEGSFNAFAKHLPRLKKMNVQTIWFMPVTPISFVKRKGALGSYYACSDYTSINPEFGTLDEFKKLVNKAHKLGIKVMIDWVANHTGWDHIWTKTHPEFFTHDAEGKFQPPFPDWEDVIHLDYSNKDLWTAMIASMQFWVDQCDLDGFRCDMAHLVPLEFWKQARTELDAKKKLFWLAETEEIRYHEVFDASYSWELLHTMERYSRKERSINDIDAVLFKYASMYPKDALKVMFTSNHDENSHSGSEYERLGESAKPFGVLCATWNGIPLVYSGQELPVINKRLKFFDKDVIPWTNDMAMQEFYRVLLKLRLEHPALRAADPSVRTFRLDTSDNANIFGYLRKKDKDEVAVLLNLSGDNRVFKINGRVIEGAYTNVFTNQAMNIEGNATFEVGKWDYLVLTK